MTKIHSRALGVTVALGVLAASVDARAQCCPGYQLATACAGVTLTKSRWCIQNTVPSAQNALPVAFCSYGDKVVSTLESVFDIPSKEVFEFELDAQTGGAHTGTACSHFGDGVAYDAFTGSSYGATSFWGYLLSLHEAINVWTGMSSSGWPTDWWADHQSAFPNLMDFHVMNTLGEDNKDQNLIKSAAAQKKRFYPGGDSADAKVVALDNVFLAMPGGDGYGGFSHMFALQRADGVKWDGLGVGNPDVKRSEYVLAYMSLAAQRNVLATLQGPGDNGGGKICNGTPDGTAGDVPYTCSKAHVESIANAHCAILAKASPASDVSALRSGDYPSVGEGPCNAACTGECACDGSGHCVARWLGIPGDDDAGADVDARGHDPVGSRDASGNAGGDSSGSTAKGGSGVSGGSSNAGSAGQTGSDERGTGGSGGSGRISGDVGAPGSASASPVDDAAGCSCRSAPASPSRAASWRITAAAAALLAAARAHRRPRGRRVSSSRVRS